MVLYKDLDGRGAFDRCDELTDAVAEVEQLRNEQGIEDAQIFRLEEVKFEIKPYFRVEIPGALTEAPSVPATEAPSTPAVERTTSWAPVTASSTDLPAMIVAPPPPPPPAPVAPMAFDGGAGAADDDVIVGSRRGLFGR
jgi:hypothetical protein